MIFLLHQNLESLEYSAIIWLFAALTITSLELVIDKSSFEVFGNVTSSPSFSLQEIADPSYDWVDFWRGKPNNTGPSYLDIQYVNYYSNGKSLNATIWLTKPELQNGSSLTLPRDRTVDYGMYIDADFNNRTGIGGIDFIVELHWNNETQKWTRIVEEWASNSNAKVLSESSNYTDLSEEDGYLSLSIDMESISSPSSYKVIFYAQEIKGKLHTIDHTNWVYVPPPEFTITTVPSFLELRAGETKTIEVKVESVKGFEPAVSLSTLDQPEGIKLKFKYDKLRIPSYGIATTSLDVTTAQNTSQRPHTVNIFADFTFPTERFISPFLEAKSQMVHDQSSLAVEVSKPTTMIDEINDFWQKLGSPINFGYIVAAALAPFIYALVKRRFDRARRNEGARQEEKGLG
jgi:hypothetical protein